jgi:4-hydroxyproline epimerase
MNTDRSVRVIDSHTGGEPTRVVIDGAPDLGNGPIGKRLQVLRNDHDWFRSAIVNEPRGSDVMVGALLCQPADPQSSAATIFFNNVGYLGMCGHGAIGLAVTMAHLGRLSTGAHRLETPAGTVSITLHDPHRASVGNVASYRYRKDFTLPVPEIGNVTGDIAWGGNWFFLVSDHGQSLDYRYVDQLTDYAWAIRSQLDAQGVRGPGGEFIDHVDLFGPPSDPAIADSRNFVLCPGKAYDRSPCGTGTSAKLACLFEDEKLTEGDVWRQQSITGSIFEARGETMENGVLPTITGTAYVTGDSTLYFDADDPFVHGLTLRNGDLP